MCDGRYDVMQHRTEGQGCRWAAKSLLKAEEGQISFK